MEPEFEGEELVEPLDVPMDVMIETMSDGIIGATFTVGQSEPLGILTTVDIDIPVNPGHELNLIGLDLSTVRLHNGEHENFIQFAMGAIQEVLPEFDPGERFGVIVQVTLVRTSPGSDKTLNRITISMRTVMSSLDDLDLTWAAVQEWIEDYYDHEGQSEYWAFISESNSTSHAVSNFKIGFFNVQEAAPSEAEEEMDLQVEENIIGGCWGDFRRSLFPVNLKRGHKLVDPPSTDNNCFFACLYHLYPEWIESCIPSIKQHHHPRDKMKVFRLECGIEHKQALLLKDIRRVMRMVGGHLKLYAMGRIRLEDDLLWDMEIKDPIIVVENVRKISPVDMKILNCEQHFCICLKESITHFKRCRSCKTWFNTNNTKGNEHPLRCKTCYVCNAQLSKKGKEHICKEKKDRRDYLKKSTKLNMGEYICDRNIFFADLETFPDEEGHMMVYSSALLAIEQLEDIKKCGRYDCANNILCDKYYGAGGFDLFMLDIIQLSGTVVFYNGSRFDLFFVFKWLVENGIKIETYLKDVNSNKIISMTVGKVKFWDMCLFTLGSLHSTCESFGVPKQYMKKDFEHEKIKTWEDVAWHKEEVIIYNCYDVISMGIAFENFAKTIWELYKFNVTEAVTLSQMAYEIWKNSYCTEEELKQIKLPNREEYDFMRRSLYGGRCCPQVKYFVSDEYDLPFPEVKDYLVYLDVVSLYPYTSTVGEYPLGNFSWRTSDQDRLKLQRILNTFPIGNIKAEDKSYVLRSIAEVDVYCPNNLITPFLFSRGEKQELEQNLLTKFNQVYDGASLLEAVRLGYRIITVHRFILFSRLGNPLRTFMNHAFLQKDKAPKKSSQYTCHKYCMNNLTGKFNQALIEGDWRIFYDDKELSDISDVGDLLKFEWIVNEHGKTIAYAAEIKNLQARPTKALQIGINILAQSRVLMSIYTDFIGGYTQGNKASYYGDTDSMIISHMAHEMAKLRDIHGLFFGSAFGHLMDEFEGSKIVKGIFLSPKTYILEILHANDKRIWRIRAKGIPQDIKDVDVDDYFQNRNTDIDESDHIDRDNLKTITYSLVRGEEVLATRLTLNMNFFEMMMFDTCKVVCTYGSLKRRLHGAATAGLASRMTILLELERTINKEVWWESGKRSVGLHPCDISYPKGHLFYP